MNIMSIMSITNTTSPVCTTPAVPVPPVLSTPSSDAALDPDPPRFLSKATYAALLKQIRSFASARGDTYSTMDSRWRSDVRWARNRATMAGDWRNVGVTVERSDIDVRDSFSAYTNQLDAGSLQDAVRWDETVGQMFEGAWAPRDDDDDDLLSPRRPPFAYPATHVWSDATYRQSYETRVTIANQLIAGAEAAGMLSAGYLAVDAGGAMMELPNKYILYTPYTEVQCSMTVRDPEGSGSGWAGISSYDWNRIDAAKLAAIALDKCLKSRHPVRIEPGRYTVIMEPQATYELLFPLFYLPPLYGFLDLVKNLNEVNWPFAIPERKVVKVSDYGGSAVLAQTRVGQRVFDERLNLYFEPADPELGRIPWDFQSGGLPIQPVQWIKNGVLETLSYPPNLHYLGMGDLAKAIDKKGKQNLMSFRLDTGTHPLTTVDEMIATTQRGVLVTRFWGVKMVEESSVLVTGATRDGVWLIENGKISHPVTNLRFTESPLFAFNQVEQIGATVPVFAPGLPAAVPTVKVRDFSFTALEDAI